MTAGERVSIRTVMRQFLVLGVVSFGGPAAHVAAMERELLVAWRGWITRERFRSLVGLTQIIPGPNSTELAILLGGDAAGGVGGVVAGVCFIVPAAILAAVFWWPYGQSGQRSHLDALGRAGMPLVLAVARVVMAA